MIKELNIPNSLGFCKKCFRSRRDGSAYCEKCSNSDELERIKIYISDNKFPLLHKVLIKFNIKNEYDLENVVFTYGDTIYAASNVIREMPFHLVAHELTHVFQQLKMGKDKWWDKYLKSNKFRLEQETEAYRQQYKVAKNKSDITGAYVLEKVAKDLSGDLYGNIISFEKAKKLILE